MSALPPVPALAAVDAVAVSVAVGAVDAANVDALGFAVYTEGDVPAELGLDREALKRAGFEAKAGSTLVLPQADGPDLVAVGAGVEAEVDATADTPDGRTVRLAALLVLELLAGAALR